MTTTTVKAPTWTDAAKKPTGLLPVREHLTALTPSAQDLREKWNLSSAIDIELGDTEVTLGQLFTLRESEYADKRVAQDAPLHYLVAMLRHFGVDNDTVILEATSTGYYLPSGYRKGSNLILAFGPQELALRLVTREGRVFAHAESSTDEQEQFFEIITHGKGGTQDEEALLTGLRLVWHTHGLSRKHPGRMLCIGLSMPLNIDPVAYPKGDPVAADQLVSSIYADLSAGIVPLQLREKGLGMVAKLSTLPPGLYEIVGNVQPRTANNIPSVAAKLALRCTWGELPGYAPDTPYTILSGGFDVKNLIAPDAVRMIKDVNTQYCRFMFLVTPLGRLYTSPDGKTYPVPKLTSPYTPGFTAPITADRLELILRTMLTTAYQQSDKDAYLLPGYALNPYVTDQPKLSYLSESTAIAPAIDYIALPVMKSAAPPAIAAGSVVEADDDDDEDGF